MFDYIAKTEIKSINNEKERKKERKNNIIFKMNIN